MQLWHLFWTITAVASQRALPQNLQDFYGTIRRHDGCIGETLKSGLQSSDSIKDDVSYCKLGDMIYLAGKKGKLTNMDVDCDGAQTHGDGRCSLSTDTQNQTSFQDELVNFGLSDINANYQPYVVFGNAAVIDFDPQQYGMKPLSVMAVVCGEKLVFGVWADVNGDKPPVVGEASIALATLCFGESMNGDEGHDEADVLYIGFTGNDTLPDDRVWQLNDSAKFEKSIETIGNRLVGKIDVNATHNEKPSGALSVATSGPAFGMLLTSLAILLI